MGTRLKNQLVTISELSDLIAIGSQVDVIDNYGAPTRSYSHSAPSIRAKVRYVDTGENEQEKQEKYTQNIKVWIRYYSGITSDQYVYWNATRWQILGIETIDGNRFHVIKCRNIAQ